MNIEMMEFKGIYHKVRSTEDLNVQLEDNVVQLSTMKSSRFYAVFEDKIVHWERALSLVSEVVEMLLGVQRKWMYLESIFMTSEDIRKQLPLEAGLFDNVNQTYKLIAADIFENCNAIHATHVDGRLDELTSMDEKLDKIQKSLDQYLETKRQYFPRFYFLSNDDLLEILGQQKDPEQVQKHISKCFVGVNKMQLIQPGVAGNKTIEAYGLEASDKESIPLVHKCRRRWAGGKWLLLLRRPCFLPSRSRCRGRMVHTGEEKDKWIHDWPGQLLITQGKVVFTADCRKALESIVKGNKKALKQVKKRQVSYIGRLSDMVRASCPRWIGKSLWLSSPWKFTQRCRGEDGQGWSKPT